MTAFVVVCAAMTAAALLWILVPLWRAPADEAGKTERRTSMVVVSVLLPAIAVGLYAVLSNWNWDEAEREKAQANQTDQALRQLEERLAQNPHDVDGWLLLGRSRAALEQVPQAIEAYERAYELTQGENVEAVVGLGEVLFLNDPNTLEGRAGQLFEAALARAPNHPKALWYGAVAALQSGDLPKGRDRLQALLAQNPPPEIQAVLQRQIDDLNVQIGEAVPPAQLESKTTEGGPAQRTIEVSVTIAPAIEKQLDGAVPLFVLARDPAGGPPLAVQRYDSTAVPLTVRLTEADAMLPTRTIASVQRVEVVARLSRSGSPQARSGDFFGAATFEFGKDSGTLHIIIDQTVP
ncbi:MAG: tetratricopeptide repeat protein [Xanthomonadaceae bacterium]|nr:tetratricopeptide repeat protein [Xanthomonadaceae bacterium]